MNSLLAEFRLAREFREAEPRVNVGLKSGAIILFGRDEIPIHLPVIRKVGDPDAEDARSTAVFVMGRLHREPELMVAVAEGTFVCSEHLSLQRFWWAFAKSEEPRSTDAIFRRQDLFFAEAGGTVLDAFHEPIKPLRSSQEKGAHPLIHAPSTDWKERARALKFSCRPRATNVRPFTWERREAQKAVDVCLREW